MSEKPTHRDDFAAGFEFASGLDSLVRTAGPAGLSSSERALLVSRLIGAATSWVR